MTLILVAMVLVVKVLAVRVLAATVLAATVLAATVLVESGGGGGKSGNSGAQATAAAAMEAVEAGAFPREHFCLGRTDARTHATRAIEGVQSINVFFGRPFLAKLRGPSPPLE